MTSYKVVVTGIRLSDGKPYKLEFTCQAESASSAVHAAADYDWTDAHTMVVNVWPVE